MEQTSNSRLPIVIFLFAVIGVSVFFWHARTVADAQQLQFAAAEQLQNERVELSERIAQLENQRIITKVEYEERHIQVPETVWHTRPSFGPRLSMKVPEVRMKNQVIRVPKAVRTEDPKVANEIKTTQERLRSAQTSLESTQSAESISSKLFGIRREIAAFIFSLFILSASLYVIINKKYRQNTEKWAYGSVGTILGYWLG